MCSKSFGERDEKGRFEDQGDQLEIASGKVFLTA
jgi:hypothetical protein